MSSQSPLEGPDAEPDLVQVQNVIPDWEFKHQPSVVLYEAVTARVGHRDALLWQSPALAMTAQAFLLTIALGHESSSAARFVAALLGLCVTFLSIQLMLKHRLHLWNDLIVMFALERKMQMSSSAVDYTTQLKSIAADPSAKDHMQPKSKNALTKLESVRVWIFGLVFFGLVNVVVLASPGLF